MKNFHPKGDEKKGAMHSNIISQKVEKVKEKMENRDGISTEFTGDGFTIFGGMRLFSKFVKRLSLQTVLQRSVSLSRRENKYNIAEYLVCIVYAFVLELTRLSDTVLLQVDKVFQRIVGLKDFPHQTTLSRFLQTFTVPIARKIGETNINLLIKIREDFKGISKITLDLEFACKNGIW